MQPVGRYVFKQAEAGPELEAVHRLNYRTFVREIPQHADPGTDRLVDKFHDRNVYFVALKDGRVVGMISAHGEPPFSVADLLVDQTLLSRPGCRPLEVRLLAVEPGERNGFALNGLLGALYEHARDRGATDLFISAVAERVGLYERLGFLPLGPAVGNGTLSFVPMKADLTRLQARQRRIIRRWRLENGAGEEPARERPPLSLLPGPVPMAPAVEAAFREPPLYHRAPEFVDRFERVRRQLGALVGGRDVALWSACGTLVNEAVAAQLAAERGATGNGVILVNGEFGERLARQAVRCGLHPRVLSWDWGKPWNLNEIEAALAAEPPGSWVWGVHLETSTGVLNDLPGLVRCAQAPGVRVCMDCISSLGAVPVDLSGVYLATGVTGKALASYAGMAMVFADAAASTPPIRSVCPAPSTSPRPWRPGGRGTPFPPPSSSPPRRPSPSMPRRTGPAPGTNNWPPSPATYGAGCGSWDCRPWRRRRAPGRESSPSARRVVRARKPSWPAVTSGVTRSAGRAATWRRGTGYRSPRWGSPPRRTSPPSSSASPAGWARRVDRLVGNLYRC